MMASIRSWDSLVMISKGSRSGSRKRTAVRLDIAKMSNFSFAAELKHERRKGTRPYSGTFGFGNSTELVEPIDYDTTSIEDHQ